MDIFKDQISATPTSHNAPWPVPIAPGTGQSFSAISPLVDRLKIAVTNHLQPRPCNGTPALRVLTCGPFIPP